MSQLDQIQGYMDVVQVCDLITSVLEDWRMEDTTNLNITKSGKKIVDVLREWSSERSTSEPAENRKRNTFFEADFNMLAWSMATYDDMISYVGILKRRAIQ